MLSVGVGHVSHTKHYNYGSRCQTNSFIFRRWLVALPLEKPFPRCAVAGKDVHVGGGGHGEPDANDAGGDQRI